jgi:hypothetical protein
MDSYEQLVAALASDGIRCRFQSPDQLVVSAQGGAPWPDRSNSFWITRATGTWHLFTWTPIGYLVPQSGDMASLCRACMAHGTSAMYSVPHSIAQQFALCELSDVEAEAVFAQMAKTA